MLILIVPVPGHCLPSTVLASALQLKNRYSTRRCILLVDLVKESSEMFSSSSICMNSQYNQPVRITKRETNVLNFNMYECMEPKTTNYSSDFRINRNAETLSRLYCE